MYKWFIHSLALKFHLQPSNALKPLFESGSINALSFLLETNKFGTIEPSLHMGIPNQMQESDIISKKYAI